MIHYVLNEIEQTSETEETDYELKVKKESVTWTDLRVMVERIMIMLGVLFSC